MKKFVSVAVASVMLLSGMAAFAGCGKLYTVDVNWDVDLSQPITLKGLYPETGIGAFGKDDTAKIIKNTTGYTIEYTELGSNADADVTNYLNTHAQFHFMKLTEAEYHAHLEKAELCDLTDLLHNTTAGRTLYQLIDLMDYGWDAVTYVDDAGQKHIYGIPDFGYVSMTDSAMIWNTRHLELIGFKNQFPDNVSGLPETLTEVTWAFEKCQERFGADKKYHAFGLNGSNSVEVTQLKGAFEVPLFFYVDDNGDIMQYVYSDNTTDYAMYMNMLRKKGILYEDWQKESSAGSLYSKFAQEKYSCVFQPYWNVNGLLDAIFTTDSETKDGMISHFGADPTAIGETESERREWIKENLIGWQLRVRGDGYSFVGDDGQTHTCKDQEKARIEGGPAGVSYYTCIPAYMQDKALYVIDFLAKKMEFFGDFYGGNGYSKEQIDAEFNGDPSKLPEDTHWYEIDAPDGAPTKEDYETYVEQYKAKGYTDESVIGELIESEVYNRWEDLGAKKIFLRPYSFSYIKYTNKDPSYGNMLHIGHVCPCGYQYDGNEEWSQLPETYVCPQCGKAKAEFTEDESDIAQEVVTYSKPGMWVQLTKRYEEVLADNSQYCNGTNAVSARILFHLRETGFNAWRVVIPTDETLIQNPMAMAPPLKLWAKHSIDCRTQLKNGICSAIDAKDGGCLTALENARQGAIQQKYWSDAIKKELTDWYKEVKLGQRV